MPEKETQHLEAIRKFEEVAAKRQPDATEAGTGSQVWKRSNRRAKAGRDGSWRSSSRVNETASPGTQRKTTAGQQEDARNKRSTVRLIIMRYWSRRGPNTGREEAYTQRNAWERSKRPGPENEEVEKTVAATESDLTRDKRGKDQAWRSSGKGSTRSRSPPKKVTRKTYAAQNSKTEGADGPQQRQRGTEPNASSE